MYESVITYQHTATDDLLFRLISTPLWLRSANIHIVTNSCKYGGLYNQDAILTTTDVAFFDDFNLQDLYFKNAVGGADTTIRLVGIVMTPGRMKELEVD